MRAVVLAAALVATPAAAQAPFESDAPRLDEMTLGEWRGYALADPASGAFGACVVGVADDETAASLNFWMGADGNLRVHLHEPDAGLVPGAIVPLEVSFNGSRRRAETTAGEAVSETALALADGEEMERRFRRSRSAEISSPFGAVDFGLRSSNQALRWLERCARRYGEGAAVPAVAIAEPAPEPDAGPPVISHLDAVVLLANGLSAAQVRDFAVATAPEDATVRFTAPAARGSIRALHPGETADIEGLRFDLLAETAAACHGRYGADNLPAAGPIALRISTSCAEAATVVREVAVLAGDRGALVAAVEGDGADTAVADALFAALADRLSDTPVAAPADAAAPEAEAELPPLDAPDAAPTLAAEAPPELAATTEALAPR